MDSNELTNRLLGGLGAWTEGKGPLYSRLAAALRASIAQGLIAPGTRLPAERSLAELLHVSRGTVVAAYGLLQEDGVVERRQGSGTVVRRPATPRPDDVTPRAALLSLVAGPEPAIDLSLAAPPSTELPLDHSISLARHRRRLATARLRADGTADPAREDRGAVHRRGVPHDPPRRS